MAAYLTRRLLYLVPVLIGLSLLAYGLSDLAPGDPARIILQRQSGQTVSDAEVESLRAELGLDAPFPVRYVRWLGRALQGDLGTSFRTGEPVLGELVSRSLRTLELAVPAFLIGMVLALPLGVLSAVRRNRVEDHAARVGALVGASMPSFWLAYLLILLFAVHLELLPVAGRGGWRHLALPTATLGVGAAAGLMRLTRAGMLEVLGEEYVRTARAKGLTTRRVMLVHALRTALIPVVTLAGLRFGYLVGGAVIVETVFAWPGLGTHVVASIHDRDYPTIQGFVLLMGVVFVLINLLIDLAYVGLDPRVRLGARAEPGRAG